MELPQRPEDAEYVAPGDLITAGRPVGRRIILSMLGLGAAGLVWGGELQRALTKATSRNGNGTSLLDALIPTERFRFYTVTGSFPKKSVEEYSLAISGKVEKPTTLTVADLSKLPQTSMTKDFQCVTGWRVSDVPWRGVLLRDLLESVNADMNAAALTFRSFDGVYTESLTMGQALRDDMLIATSMFDAPITTNHGGPVRLYAAPMYGYKSIKWLSEIEVVNEVQSGYWERFGYDIDAWIGSSNGRTDEPV